MSDIAMKNSAPERPGRPRPVGAGPVARQPRRLHRRRQPRPPADPGRGDRVRPSPARPRRPGGRRPPGRLAPAPGRLDLAQVPRLRPAPRRPDPGRQRRPDEGRQALRPRPGRSPGQLRHALDQGRDPRVHPQELAHGQGRDDQGAAQALLQPALDEAVDEGRRRRPGHAPHDPDPGRGRHARQEPERQARGSPRDGNPPLGRRRRARAAERRRRGKLRADRLPGRRRVTSRRA